MTFERYDRESLLISLGGGSAFSTSAELQAKSKMSLMASPSNCGTSTTLTSSHLMIRLTPMARSRRCQTVTVS